MITRIRAWWRQRKNRLPREETNPLREFVYLDEVSVTSLVSSREGAVPSEITDKLSDTIRSTSNASVEASAKILKSTFNSSLEAARTQDRQVLRKATIQATFKDLYEGERDSLALRYLTLDAEIPQLEVIRRILASPDAVDKNLQQWLVNPTRLQRGQLAEVEVELQADAVFQVSTFVSSFLEMFEGSSALAGQVNLDEADGVKEFNAILEKLLVGLVPIKCSLVDYGVVTINGAEYLLHRKLAEALPAPERPTMNPVYLVGVAEQDLFWKDIRRVLFSRARVKVLCRLNYVGIRSSWTAVKLADVIGFIVPGFADRFHTFVSDVLQAMIGGAGLPAQPDTARVDTLIAFGNLLAREGDLTLTEEDKTAIRRLAEENAHLLDAPLPESRKAFRQISQYLGDRHGLVVDPDVSHDLRVRARQHAGLSGDFSFQPVLGSSLTPRSTEDERYLDSEIIAIYW